jgi:nucleotide-binding universal stress UspA family protein
MKNVVIPVDFSSTAATAIKFGAFLAKLMECNLRIVHVSDLVLSGEHSLTTPEQKRDEKALEKQLADFTSLNADSVFTKNEGHTGFVPEVILSVVSGIAASQILKLSKDETTSFIVMGGVGAGAGIHPPGMYGSVATPVAMRGGCPVVLIPKGYGPVAVKRLAIAFDDADEIIRIGKFSRAIIESLQPEVRYVHVSKANWREEFENESDFMDLTWGKGGPSHIYEFNVLPEGKVAKQLSHYANDQQIDLLILGGKRQGFWSRLFDKNHLKPIIEACGVPMLIIPFSATEN